MAKIAVIKTGGKQYRVKEGETLKIEKLENAIDEVVKFETLLVSEENGEGLQLGKPSLGIVVEGKVVDQGKADKVTVLKYKNKTRYKTVRGHRQPYTKVQISKI